MGPLAGMYAEQVAQQRARVLEDFARAARGPGERRHRAVAPVLADRWSAVRAAHIWPHLRAR